MKPPDSLDEDAALELQLERDNAEKLVFKWGNDVPKVKM